MSLPRVLTLDAEGMLKMETLPALAELRAGTIAAEGMRVTLPRATGEVLGTGSGDFSLSMSDGTEELVRVSYSAARREFMAEGKTIALEPGDAATVHGFVDGSVMELILGGRVGLTKRFYYTETVAPDIVVVADGAVRLEVWRVKAISGDRLSA